MNLKRLKWYGVIIPVLFLGILEILRFIYGDKFDSAWFYSLIYMGIIILGAMAFSFKLFSYVDRMNKKLTRQNKRFKVLLHVAKAINSSLEINKILQTIIDISREYLDADYGEILIEENGEIRVYYSGIEPENCPVKIEPKLKGLKGEILRTGVPIRIKHRSQHPHSVPLPEGHPPIGPLLGVPIKLKDKIIAHIILVRKPGSPPFSKRDEDTLVILANDAAVAIERCKLNQRIQEIAILEERDRIAKELHDGLGQILGYLNVKILTIKQKIGQSNIEIQKYLDEIRDVVKETYGEVRRAIFDLKLTTIPEKGIAQALEKYLYEFSLQNNIKVDVQLDGLEGLEFPVQAEIQLMRIIQEALNNIRKHANASKILVKFETVNRLNRFIIEDDGKGFDLQKVRMIRGEPHFGLQTMRERAECIGGMLIIDSKPGKGTKIVLEFSQAELNGSQERNKVRSSHNEKNKNLIG